MEGNIDAAFVSESLVSLAFTVIAVEDEKAVDIASVTNTCRPLGGSLQSGKDSCYFHSGVSPSLVPPPALSQSDTRN